jgi:hypothetical protein
MLVPRSFLLVIFVTVLTAVLLADAPQQLGGFVWSDGKPASILHNFRDIPELT